MDKIIGAQNEFSLDRIGTFFIPDFMIEGDPDVLRLAMSGMLVVRAERLFAPPGIAYTSCSEYFDTVPRGLAPPEYRPKLKKVDLKDDKTGEAVERVFIEGWDKLTRQQKRSGQ